MASLIYFTGQDVALSVTVLDDTGSPAYGSPTVLTVTAPDGTVTTPPTVSTGLGTYTAVVPAVAHAGIYVYRWTATNLGVAFASEGQFQVRPMSIEQIVDIASVRAHLNIPQNVTSSDDELQGFILAAGELARDVCGPFLPEQHVQWLSGGGTTLELDWLPLASIQSVTEYYGLAAFPVTEQPLGAQANAFAFTADYNVGTLTRRTFGGQAALWAIGTKNVRVAYTAGRAGQVPYTVRLGALELIRHLWQLTQQGGRPRFGGAGEGDVHVPIGFALPDRVVELWAPYRRPPGIA